MRSSGATWTSTTITSLMPGDVFIGQTVATPTDGTNQYNGVGGAPIGQWRFTSVVNMNDPAACSPH